MIETASTILMAGVGLYLLIGLLFALPFVLRGAGRIDSAAKQGSRGFRIMILPGTIALWPILARRWRNTTRKSS